MYPHLYITITRKENTLSAVSLVVHGDGTAETMEHGEVPKTTETDDVRQELTLLSIVANRRVRALECAIIGFSADFKKNTIIGAYVLRPH
jgi:hypothetical protein